MNYDAKKSEPVLAYAQLNARIMPIARGEIFETPLKEALEENGFGLVGGGGTLQSKTGEIEYCGVDVDLFDVKKGASFVCRFLSDRGAPRGSKLCYEFDAKAVELPFGTLEGLAIYLNGTELPDEVYAKCDINVVLDTFAELLGNRWTFRGYWHGPTETALYLYGKSAKKVRDSISGFIAEYPLCQRARIEVIA